MAQFVADDFSTIRRERDKLRSGGNSLEIAAGEDLDKIGQAYHIYRKPVEPDYDYRERIEAERKKQ